MQTAAEKLVVLTLEQQVNCYRRLAKLAEAQHEFVEQGQTDKLLEILGQRQQLLDQIAELEKSLAHAKRQWSQYVSGLTAAQREHAEELLLETRVLLEQITTADRNDALVLQQRKLNLGRQVTQAAAARTVNRNYAASAYGSRASRVDIQQ
jgi:hypothetical protein